MSATNPVELTTSKGQRVGNTVMLPLTAFDAFGRQRVSTPYTVFDSKQISDNQPLFWDDAEVSGGGTSSTYNTNKASTTIAVSNAIAGHRVRQTFRYFNYQPGKSQKVTITAYVHSANAGVTKRFGLFNANNGLFIQLTGSGWAFGKRTFTGGVAVDTIYPQSKWNLDKFDGNGVSGLKLTTTGRVLFILDFEWLAVGQVRFGFIIGGQIYYAHAQDYANDDDSGIVYMSTPNLPVRFEIINDGTGVATGLTHICCEVSSEGGVEYNGFDLSVDRGVTPLTTLNDNDLYPLIAIRLKSNYLGATIQPLFLSIMCDSTTDFRWCLLLNPTVTGTAFNFTGVTNSAIEADVSTTNASKISGGTLFKSGYTRSTAQSGGDVFFTLPSFLAIGSKINGTRDIMVLGVQRLVGAVETFYSSLGWRESV